MKAITGDKGDDVPGCTGVGDVTALKYLRGELTKGKKFEAIEAWKADENGYALAKRLTDLRDIEIPTAALQLTPGKFDQMEAFRLLSHYGFESIISQFNHWMEPFARAA